VAGDGRVSLTWTAPADDGGSAITGYRIVPFIGSNAQPAIDTGATDTSATVTGLANGTAYTFRVAGLNGVGEGVYSAASAPVTPASSAPSSFVYSDDFESGSLGGYTQLNTGTGSASASPAAAHQGGYGLRLADDAGQFALAAHSLGADPLTDSSTTFWVRLTATSGMVTVAEGRSASAARAWDLIYDATHRGFYYYPYGASGSVEIFTGNNTASAPGTWMQIQLDYDATASGGAQILINGATQRAWSRTGNFAGAAGYQTLQLWNDGQGSADFDDVAVGSAAGLAAAPTGVTASPQSDGSVTVKWDAPAGGGITSYRVTPYLGTAAQTPAYSPTASANVGGLTLGSTYTFKVAAINAVGTGPDSAASAAALAATPPDAPSGITPSPGDGRVTVQWTAPANTGGSPVTGYTVTPYAGATAGTPVTVGNVSSTVVSGLVNGTAYTFRVAAVNAVGTGAQSAASASVTPAATASTVPGVLGGPVTATASGFGAAALTWKAATSDGGSPILGYRITPVIGGVGGPVQTPVDVSPTATSYTLTGLNGNTTYLIRVQAFNANGVGPANAGALVVRGGPTNVTATASDGAVTINWALPANTTSSQLTNYLVYPYIGSQRAPGLPGVWIPVTSTSMTMDGLTDGTTYNFHVEAVSSAWGNSPDSISNEATPSVWTPPATPYTNTVFTDTFESGRGNWTVLQPPRARPGARTAWASERGARAAARTPWTSTPAPRTRASRTTRCRRR
jgi:titin